MNWDSWNLCQFLIGKVQRKKRQSKGKPLFLYTMCQFLIGKVQLNLVKVVKN